MKVCLKNKARNKAISQFDLQVERKKSKLSRIVLILNIDYHVRVLNELISVDENGVFPQFVRDASVQNLLNAPSYKTC